MKGMIAAAAAALAIGLAGCPAAPGEAVENTTPHLPAWKPAPGPIKGFDQADLVSFDDGHAVFYSLANDQLTEVGRVDIGHWGIDVAEWANRDTLYLNGLDREVLRLTAAGVTVIPVPPVSDFTFKHDPDESGEDAEWEELGVDDRGAWYGYCPFARYGDVDYVCERWGWIGIDGEAKGKKEMGGEHLGREFEWPDDYKPEESCPEQNSASGYQPVESHWVSSDPPTQLIEYGYKSGSYTQIYQWELKKGCDDTVLYTGLSARPGPDGLWIGRQGDYEEVANDFLFRGATRIGRIRGGDVRFRPAK